MNSSRLIRLLPIACIAAAVLLFASELMTTFEFTPPGAEPLADQGGADRHGNALALLAAFAIGAVLVAVFAASKPAAIAVAASGGISLLVFLLVDLPDANAVGTLNDARQSYFDAEAVPQGGFFLEMIGALLLTITGVALATLTPEQLDSLRPRDKERSEPPPRPRVADDEAKPVKAAHEAGETTAKRRLLPNRIRTRQRG